MALFSVLFSRKVMRERDAKDVALAQLTLMNRRLTDQTALALANEKKALQNADEVRKEKHRAELETVKKTQAFKALLEAEVRANWESALNALGKREPSLAVAHLVKALRLDPSHQLAGRMLVGILSETVFPQWKCRPWGAGDGSRKNQGDTLVQDGFLGEVDDIQLSRDGTRALATLYGGGCHLVDATSGRSLWNDQAARDVAPEKVARYVFSADGKYVLGVAEVAGKSKQAVHRLVSAVQACDGTALPDAHTLAQARQAEINAIGGVGHPTRPSPVNHKKPGKNGVQITSKGIFIKGDEDNMYRISTLERVANYWLSPNKKWFCFNGIDPETFDGEELDLSTGWTYKFEIESTPESVRADLNYYELVTFDSGSRFMAKNLWTMGYEGPGLAGVDRLSNKPDRLELPVQGEMYRAVIGASNVLVISGVGRMVYFFDLPEAPLGVDALPVAPACGDAGLVWNEDPQGLDENEKQWARTILSSCGAGPEFWKRKLPAAFTTWGHDRLVMLVDDQVCVVGKGDAEVRRWKLPDGMGFSEEDDSNEIREAFRVFKTGERKFAIARTRLGNRGTEILFAVFEDDGGPPLVQSFNLGQVDSGDSQVGCLKNGSQFIVLTPGEFLVLDAAALTEAGRYRFDRRDLPVYSHLRKSMDLFPDEDFLKWAEYIGGWRFNANGGYEPVGYSEKQAIHWNGSGGDRKKTP
jgi:hypothetical protein